MRDHYWNLVGVVAPVFLIIGAGYAIRIAGWLSAEADVSLRRLIINLLYPCLIFDTVLGNRALSQPGNLMFAPALGFGTVVLGYGLAFVVCPLFGINDPRRRRTFSFTTGLYNYSYVALPLVQKLFEPQTTGVLFIFNVGVEVAIWTVGLMMLTGGSQGRGWTHLFNAPVLAILAALALHFAGAKTWLPDVALSAIHSLGTAAIPLGLVLTGATFSDHIRTLDYRNGLSVCAASTLLRLGILPVLFILIARWLPCPVELRRVILIQAAMPCAVVPVILSKHYRGDPALAMLIVLVTLLLGLVTIPWWIQWGMRMVPV